MNEKCRQDKTGVDGRNQTSCISCVQLPWRDSAQSARHSAKSPSPHPPRPAPQHALASAAWQRPASSPSEPRIALAFATPARALGSRPDATSLTSSLAQHTANPLPRRSRPSLAAQ
ncbi:hypothetical protein L226DRAFT_9008 [Lentinus tigrinus ALCF2SS1-7]|uniref:Uncharacterized protein n=1 Tax=Lentinus tigrinus ALCF2SS1-6 TaxID=1328759 RepID=A0A5C2SIK2_9APHY|nr:hypothetical protein L227DRAFT_414167 [Lentinus tigrinus ALCF2SS1-6]RPD81840.1 hypothetical protein L226DRAFT_9008 [Lentinus tigrinus ALCF2SS1-7]